MPTVGQLKQYLTLSVVPVLAGAGANWLIVHVHFLASFHLRAGTVAAGLTQLGVFGVSAGLAFLASHHILKGTYALAPSGGLLPISYSAGNVASWSGISPEMGIKLAPKAPVSPEAPAAASEPTPAAPPAS